MTWQLTTLTTLTFCITSMMGCGGGKPSTSQTVPMTPLTASADQTEFASSVTPETPLEVMLEESTPEPSATNADSPSEVVAKTAADIESAPVKPTREPIYDTVVSGQELIAAAVRRAKRDHKHVLIEWGGNWCGWCYRLHDVFTKNFDVRPIVFEEFELVLVDSNSNQELLAEYGGKDRQFSYPHLTVLDPEGKVLTNQNTEPLEEGKGHSPKAVAEFLKQWMPGKIDAQSLLSQQLKTASDENKRVIIRVGTPYCGWCKELAQFMQDHQALFAKDYLDVKIDTLRMTNGEQAIAGYRREDLLGDPWMVILDGTGKTLATSASLKGNIGYPYQSEEIAHLVKMLRETRQTLSDAELDSITADLEAYRVQREQKLAEQKSKSDR